MTWNILEETLGDHGIGSVRVPINIDQLESFTSAFLTNSMGVAPIARIGETYIPEQLNVVPKLTAVYEQAQWDDI